MAEKEYIERDMYYQKINGLSKGGCGDYPLYRLAINDCMNVLDEMPAADVAPVRHGHWILLRESEITGFNPEFAGRDPIGGYQCSNCKKEAILDCNDEFVLSSYCPNCGAKMDGGD